ncbi:MAG: hypothetical protein BWY47_01932 [Bacteroidetes bacterium ADurb.Bin302]|nr:MAG: hypothetical protein BWY47_01932 [Bacteroidetes bacterium ADurb.Bin302]
MSDIIAKIKERNELRSRLQILDSQIESAQRNCTHTFPEAKYDPETEKVPYGIKYEGHGSDVWPVASGYTDKEVPRWSRTCKLCGKTEYTKEQAPTAFKPKFNS